MMMVQSIYGANLIIFTIMHVYHVEVEVNVYFRGKRPR